MTYPCRGCDGTCCTGIPGYPCTCPPPPDDGLSREMRTVLDALRERGSDAFVMDVADVFFQCPAHDDRCPSLTVEQTEGGVTIRCHSGCSTGEILRHLGLTWSDLLSREEADEA